MFQSTLEEVWFMTDNRTLANNVLLYIEEEEVILS